MKLLLDEHFPPVIAEQLRTRGHDALAIAEQEELRGLEDALLLEVAYQDNLVIVTENGGDFRRLAAARLQSGLSHSGIVLTTHRTFPRGHPRTVGRLVTALERLLTDPPEGDSWERWLT